MMHHASLIWITPDAEKLVGKIARVSNPKNEDNPDVERLLRYLVKHKHWSPFEMASMCVEIETTRAISPQILRHRSGSFQEFSQRYAEATTLEIPQIRRQDEKNRQNSIDDVSQETTSYYKDRIEKHFKESMELYESMLHSGIAKECARAVLPASTGTRMYMSATLRTWMHYIDLRSANGTQLEHQMIAKSIRDIFIEQCPTIARAMWE